MRRPTIHALLAGLMSTTGQPLGEARIYAPLELREAGQHHRSLLAVLARRDLGHGCWTQRAHELVTCWRRAALVRAAALAVVCGAAPSSNATAAQAARPRGARRRISRTVSIPDRVASGPPAARMSSRPLALHALAQQLAVAAHRLGLFAGAALRRLLVIAPQLHFPEHPFALHFLLQGSESLVDIVVANEDLHGICRLRSWGP